MGVNERCYVVTQIWPRQSRSNLFVIKSLLRLRHVIYVPYVDMSIVARAEESVSPQCQENCQIMPNQSSPLPIQPLCDRFNPPIAFHTMYVPPRTLYFLQIRPFLKGSWRQVMLSTIVHSLSSLLSRQQHRLHRYQMNRLYTMCYMGSVHLTLLERLPTFCFDRFLHKNQPTIDFWPRFQQWAQHSQLYRRNSPQFAITQGQLFLPTMAYTQLLWWTLAMSYC